MRTTSRGYFRSAVAEVLGPITAAHSVRSVPCAEYGDKIIIDGKIKKTHACQTAVLNEGQSNLAIGGIGANRGFRPPNLPVLRAIGAPV